MKKNILILLLVFASGYAFAEAPVVDYSSDVMPATDKAFTMPSNNTNRRPSYNYGNPGQGVGEQRISRLENQVSNINEQNLSRRIEELQQTVQKLNGKIEFQEHQIEELNKRVKNFYQDLNQRLDDAGSKANISGSLPPVATGSAAAVADVEGRVAKKDSFKEQQMYQKAIDLLPEKKNESKDKLRAYLKRYPKGAYVANAHYWLGEINFLQKDFDAAEEEFKVVINKYKNSRRVSDAKLKLALVHRNQGRESQAKKELNEVMRLYPGTSASQLAKQQLTSK